MNQKIFFICCTFILAALVLAACGSEEAVKTVEVTRIVTQEVIVEVTPMPEEGEPISGGDVEFTTLNELAEGIRSGDIDVGEEFGIEMGKRFHTIHAETVGMSCGQCHVQDAPDEVAPAPEGSPGVVDRRVCTGCHLNGPATLLYETKE